MARALLFVALRPVPIGFVPVTFDGSNERKEINAACKVASADDRASDASAWGSLVLRSARYQHLR
jgi:hypothetical protein